MQGGKHAATLIGGQLFRVGIQGGYFVLLARALGTTDYGTVAAILALLGLLGPYSNLGATPLLIRNVSIRRERAAVQWANTVILTVLSGAALTGLAALCTPWMTGGRLEWPAVVGVGLSELVCARLVESAMGLRQALGYMESSSHLQAVLQATRLAALVVVMAVTGVTLGTWSLSYVIGSILPAAWYCFAAVRHVGAVRPRFTDFVAEWKVAALFAISMSSKTVYSDVDKVLLTRLSNVTENGIYSAAYRIVDMSYVPVRALLQVALPAMHRASHGAANGVQEVLVVARRQLALPIAAYCVAGTIGMVAAANVVPIVLGHSFAESVPALRILGLLLMLKGAHYIAADTLTCGGRQGWRTIVQVSIAVLNVVLCLVLIPPFGWRGAAVASLASDGLLAVSLWLLIWRATRVPRGLAVEG